jgi:beta-glucanase (GH16 family)
VAETGLTTPKHSSAVGTVIRVLVGLLLLAAVGLGLHGWGSAPAQTGRAPAPAVDARAPIDHVAMPTGNLPGWREVFSDNFSGSKLNLSKWRLYWGRPGGDPAGWWLPSHVKVSHGMLVISAYRDRAHGGQWATGGVSSAPGLAQTYGKYLVRFRMDAGFGVSHALLLFPANNTWPPEVDFSEDNGTGSVGVLATLHYGANDQHQFEKLPINVTQWHTLGVEWLPGSLTFTVDGRDWYVIHGREVPSIPMAMDIQEATWPCRGSWGRCPNFTTPRVVHLDVDWVVAYAPAA